MSGPACSWGRSAKPGSKPPLFFSFCAGLTARAGAPVRRAPPGQPSPGAGMLSLLLGCAFLSRQFWGLVTDRIGGLRTVLAGSVCQITAMAGFLLTQDEAGLFAVAAMFGLGFSGIIPAYVVAIRELFPAAEASWRIPTLLLFSGSGMAARRRLPRAVFHHGRVFAPALPLRVRLQLRP